LTFEPVFASFVGFLDVVPMKKRPLLIATINGLVLSSSILFFRNPELLPKKVVFWSYKDIRQPNESEMYWCLSKLREAGFPNPDIICKLFVTSFQKNKFNTINTLGSNVPFLLIVPAPFLAPPDTLISTAYQLTNEGLIKDRSLRDIDSEVKEDTEDKWRMEIVRHHNVFLCTSEDVLVQYRLALVDIVSQHKVNKIFTGVVAYFLTMLSALLIRKSPAMFRILLPFSGFFIATGASTFRFKNETRLKIALHRSPKIAPYALRYLLGDHISIPEMCRLIR
jgi:hypothetical protein